ncbi:MAG TPA: hypothetical protein PLL32_10965, partial [Anaeromyxobacteraceae bacterium]|nr:hypothetical protein [Anaeromyxobacteraceae bacterium]
MDRIGRAGPFALWTLQWSLAVAILLVGLVEVGLSGAIPTRGLLLAAAAAALVVPSACQFLPGLSPLAASGLGFTLATGATSPADTLLAVGCVIVAIARGFIAPIEPADLRAEQVDPWARAVDRCGGRREGAMSSRRARRPERVPT